MPNVSFDPLVGPVVGPGGGEGGPEECCGGVRRLGLSSFPQTLSFTPAPTVHEDDLKFRLNPTRDLRVGTFDLGPSPSVSRLFVRSGGWGRGLNEWVRGVGWFKGH